MKSGFPLVFPDFVCKFPSRNQQILVPRVFCCLHWVSRQGSNNFPLTAKHCWCVRNTCRRRKVTEDYQLTGSIVELVSIKNTAPSQVLHLTLLEASPTGMYLTITFCYKRQCQDFGKKQPQKQIFQLLLKTCPFFVHHPQKK